MFRVLPGYLYCTTARERDDCESNNKARIRQNDYKSNQNNCKARLISNAASVDNFILFFHTRETQNLNLNANGSFHSSVSISIESFHSRSYLQTILAWEIKLTLTSGTFQVSRVKLLILFRARDLFSRIRCRNCQSRNNIYSFRLSRIPSCPFSHGM